MRYAFEKKVMSFMEEQELLASGDRILVGLSGGADSVCLLAVLHRLAEQLSAELGAFHVNHGIRGAEADRDEAFSAELCHRFGIPFFAVKEDVPGKAKEWQMGEEEAGRRVRYEAAERIARDNGYNKIALAHHRNDVAETLLFHLFRGSSLAGLSSIPAKRGMVIRPLLCCEREEIEAYLEAAELSFCTDATNEETEYTRNKIRHKIVAFAKAEINAGAVRHMAEAAAQLSETEEFLATETEAVCNEALETAEGIFFSVNMLKEKHRLLQQRAIYVMLGKVAGTRKDITREHVEAVLGLLERQSGKRVSLPYGVVAVREFDRLLLKKEGEIRTKEQPECHPVTVPGEYSFGKTGEVLRFRVFPYQKNEEIPKNEYTKWFDYDKIRGTLYLRTYCAGDRIGLSVGNKTVKSVWTEHKIPAEERGRRLLLADEEQVLWIPDVRCCDNYRVDDGTKTVLEVQRNGGK